MMSSAECDLKAARCEEMARNCADPADRSMLLDTAMIWRKLAGLPPIPARDLAPEAL